MFVWQLSYLLLTKVNFKKLWAKPYLSQNGSLYSGARRELKWLSLLTHRLSKGVTSDVTVTYGLV